MLTNDLRPNRLVRARLFAQELLREIAGNRVGLLFFAGDAFLSMPLSTDYATINNFLAEADPESFSAQGTAIESVVNLARKSFDPEGGGRALVIITDGEDHEDSPVDALSDAFSEEKLYPDTLLVTPLIFPLVYSSFGNSTELIAAPPVAPVIVTLPLVATTFLKEINVTPLSILNILLSVFKHTPGLLTPLVAVERPCAVLTKNSFGRPREFVATSPSPVIVPESWNRSLSGTYPT
jgi:hypothetical protein